MTQNGLPQRWAKQFGLAWVPLFEYDEVTNDDAHAVLLDGGYGSFAMSVTTEELWRDKDPACWAWSSNLPHHVTVTDSVVAVTRWDSESSEVLSRSSVEAYIEPFYSYLAADRVESSQRVVNYVLNLFRQVRSLVADSDLPDERSVDVFLAFLARIMERDRYEKGGQDRMALLNAEGGAELLRELPNSGICALLDYIGEPSALHPFRLFPSLAVRHAGSEIFQEAHFELLRAPSPDLFGYAAPAEAKTITRGGAHFTPAALARCLVEQTLQQVEGLEERERVTVLDPACGSGSFLHEALRALRRMNYSGEIVVVGRDVSPAAISMANFVARHAAADWSPERAIEIDILVGDSLNDPLPHADVILMNPPFISWPSLNDIQRDQMRLVLGNRLRGRGDLSMAFVSRAVDFLSAGGAIGVLLPASLLTLESAERWRSDLLEHTDLRLIGSLGDYGLFAHAVVQVAVAVLCKPTDGEIGSGRTKALVTTNSAEATGNALRNLRRSDRQILDIGANDAWQLFNLPTRVFRSRATWRLTTPRAEAALAKLIDSGTSLVSDLFTVRQGVLTGDNRAFVLNRIEFNSLPPREQQFFKPAIMNKSIRDGRLRRLFWVFYPYEDDGPVFRSEKALLTTVPRYCERFLMPKREKLRARKSLLRTNRQDWWGLSWTRTTWAFDTSPRLVSKYFGGSGGFAVDLEPDFLMVQGYVWFLKYIRPDDEEHREGIILPDDDLLCAYMAIFNSRRFADVLGLFSPHVAGGQFNLSPRYVNRIPIPNLADLSQDERMGKLVSKLLQLGREPKLTDRAWIELTDRITIELYGRDFFDRVL